MESTFSSTLWSDIALWGLLVYFPVVITGIHLATKPSAKNPNDEALLDHEIFNVVFLIVNLVWPGYFGFAMQAAGMRDAAAWTAAGAMWVSVLFAMVFVSMYREDRLPEDLRESRMETMRNFLETRNGLTGRN